MSSFNMTDRLNLKSSSQNFEQVAAELFFEAPFPAICPGQINTSTNAMKILKYMAFSALQTGDENP